ncbi:MAG TPA: lactate utilization protein [Verrucomicrobiae bacterium]|nr:lactate utilization protein [Verrucomicrobiae bacterium]
MTRDHILHRIRTALGRSAGQAVADPPPVRIRIAEVDREARVRSFTTRLEALAGKVYYVTTDAEARDLVASAIEGKTAVASNAPYLRECGITGIAGVETGITGRDELRERCAAAGVGITSADYALADTGSLVMLSTPREARLVSLLPPAHIAVVPVERLLTGLDELMSILPHPGDATSSMVLITGPSRTADIEQILVRGVHGPGQITVVLVG